MQHRHLTLWSGILFLSAGAFATTEVDVPERPAGDALILTDWHGSWVGELENSPAATQGITVRFTIDEGEPNDGCLTWNSEYFARSEGKGVKNYRLCRAPGGEFVIDEGDGILLRVSLFGNDLYSAFALTESKLVLFTHTRLEGDVIVHDIFSARQPDTAEADVVSYKGLSRQRVVFRRQKVGASR